MTTDTTIGDIGRQDENLDELKARLDAHEDELVDLLDLLVATKRLSEELAPDLQEANLEYRATIDELRVAFQREETVELLLAVGDNAEELTDLLEFVEAAGDLAEELAPELQSLALESREPIDQLREALEDQEPLLLLRRLAEHTNTFIELLDLLEATEGVLADLLPELQEVALESREALDQLRLFRAGMADGAGRDEFDPYRTGRRFSRLLGLVERAGEPELVAALDAGLTAFTDDQPAPKRGFWGTVRAFWDSDVQQGVGTVIECLRRIGAAMQDSTKPDKYLP